MPEPDPNSIKSGSLEVRLGTQACPPSTLYSEHHRTSTNLVRSPVPPWWLGHPSISLQALCGVHFLAGVCKTEKWKWGFGGHRPAPPSYLGV